MEASLSIKRLVPSNAFILYHPKTEGYKEQVSYNNEAWRILSHNASHSNPQKSPSIDFSLLCARWKELLDGRFNESEIPGKARKADAAFIDLHQSGRRRYVIRGIVLSENLVATQNQEHYYLFVLERISPNEVNLSMISRQWSLNRREKEIVKLILEDRSNKEIASLLGLSPNTIKGYMKLLMRKLGVSSRAGIISCLLTGNNPTSHQSR
jgi:DNA-binding CsgD family transcriptional regulator